jgi:hypothetical protein
MRILLGILGVALAMPVQAQIAAVNPFRYSFQTGAVKTALIAYSLAGDQAGTEEFALAAERRATRTNATTRVLGKDVKQNQLEIDTGDSTYRVDLEKKEGYRAPSRARAMADEYEKLSPAEKQRFDANATALAGIMAQAFGVGALTGVAQAHGQQTVAGQLCEVHKVGDFTVCTLVGAPAIPLRVEGEVMCLRMNKVATAATLNAAVPPDRFALPTDVKWKSDQAPMSEDEARQFVRHLASQEATDSILRMQQQMQTARDSARARQTGVGGAQRGDSLTLEQHEQLCRTMREGIRLRLEITPPNPAKLVQQEAAAQMAGVDSLAKSAVKGAADSAVSKAKKGIFGKIKKPTFP